jgi:alanine racemase
MDQMMIDLGINGEAYVDDEVLLVGSSQSHCISLYDLADLSGTSVYEVLCRISYRVRREYMDTDK